MHYLILGLGRRNFFLFWYRGIVISTVRLRTVSWRTFAQHAGLRERLLHSSWVREQLLLGNTPSRVRVGMCLQLTLARSRKINNSAESER